MLDEVTFQGILYANYLPTKTRARAGEENSPAKVEVAAGKMTIMQMILVKVNT